MISGIGRHQLRNGAFEVRSNLRGIDPPRGLGAVLGAARPHEETAGIPDNTVVNAFVKPVAMPLNIGIVSDHPQAQIMLAREMFDNDAIAGAVAETLGNIPFGRFSLSGLPDVKQQEPYLRSLDHMRVQTLMPLMATTFLVDGAFLGSGMFDANSRSWSAMVLQDLQHATIRPVPYFGATPIIDVMLTPEMIRSINSTDPRMARYRQFISSDVERGLQLLQPENTFYVPRRTMAHHTLGQSLFRRIMVIYTLEKALARGTIEMAYRRLKPILHIQAGDENWNATIPEMQAIGGLFQNADLDPLGATVVTRPGVMPQEVGGPGDFWKWTDSIDGLTSAKLKGLGMPDGLLGGDVALDSVSATLTVFINMNRQFRDYITRAFMYEKMFPYLAVTNGHRKDVMGAFEERGSMAWAYRAHAADLDVDMSEYLMPTVSWHNSMRPEGDRDYLALLTELGQAGVPIPLRILAAAGGQDMHDILNGEKEDLKMRGETAEYQARIAAFQAAQQPQQDDDQYNATGGVMNAGGRRVRRKGLANREYDDRHLPRTSINGHGYLTTARERKHMMEKENRTVAAAASNVARRENFYNRNVQVVRHGPMGLCPV